MLYIICIYIGNECIDMNVWAEWRKDVFIR